MTAAFLCGLACADEAHLAALPESLVDSLGLEYAEIEIVPTRGSEKRLVYPVSGVDEEVAREGTFEFRDTLRDETVFRLYVHLGGRRALSSRQRETLTRIAELACRMLDCVLVQQHDRSELKHGFETLSEREWEVCRELEGVASEKMIAEKLGRSRFTVHAHVKRVYAALGVTGRKQVVELLGKAREKLRIEALRQICLREPLQAVQGAADRN